MANLPGTKISAEKITPGIAEMLLGNAFLCGGLTLSQVAALCDIELYTVQNWVHRGFVSSPKSKKYNKRQFCRLVIINMLKDALQLSDIAVMLSSINGVLSDESDDTVADDDLYILFLELLCTVNEGCSEAEIEKTADKLSGENKKLKNVLTSMYYAYRSSQFKKKATEIIGSNIK